MKKKYEIILKSILSNEEIECLDVLEECSNDILFERSLCKNNHVFFFDWADGYERIEQFYSFVRRRSKALTNTSIELLDKHVLIQQLAGELDKKGNFIPLLIRHINLQLEKYGIICVSISSYDDTYRICAARRSCIHLLDKIDFLEGKITYNF